jgi:hypothetical protein
MGQYSPPADIGRRVLLKQTRCIMDLVLSAQVPSLLFPSPSFAMRYVIITRYSHCRSETNVIPHAYVNSEFKLILCYK